LINNKEYPKGSYALAPNLGVVKIKTTKKPRIPYWISLQPGLLGLFLWSTLSNVLDYKRNFLLLNSVEKTLK